MDNKDSIKEITDIISADNDYVNDFIADNSNVSEVYKFLDSLIKDLDSFNYVKQLLEKYPHFANIKKSKDEYLFLKVFRKYKTVSKENNNPAKINHYYNIIKLFMNSPNFKMPKRITELALDEMKYDLAKANSYDSKDPEATRRIVFNLEEGIKLLDETKKNIKSTKEELTYKYQIDTEFSTEAIEDSNKLNSGYEIKSDDTNKLIIPINSFSKEALDSLGNYVNVDNIAYLDKSNDTVITIDSSLGHFYEDACSIKKLDNGNYLVEVYVIDIDKVIPIGSRLNKEAFLRGENIYLPNRDIVHMLPASLRTSICSFEENLNRVAIDYIFEFSENSNNELNLENFSASRAIVKVKKNLIHKDFTEYLKGHIKDDTGIEEMANVFFEFIKKYNKSNIYKVKDFHKGNSLSKGDTGVPSVIVQALNTLTNYKVAEYFKNSDIPFIYYTCPRSQNSKQIQDIRKYVKKDGIISELLDKLTNFYAKPKLKVVPEEFATLNLDVYTTMTSPGRRYVDLINEDRVKKYLVDKNPYTFNKQADLIYLQGVCDYLNQRIDLNNSYKSDFGEIKNTTSTPHKSKKEIKEEKKAKKKKGKNK